jgi:hypothetical protein
MYIGSERPGLGDISTACRMKYISKSPAVAYTQFWGNSIGYMSTRTYIYKYIYIYEILGSWHHQYWNIAEYWHYWHKIFKFPSSIVKCKFKKPLVSVLHRKNCLKTYMALVAQWNGIQTTSAGKENFKYGEEIRKKYYLNHCYCQVTRCPQN